MINSLWWTNHCECNLVKKKNLNKVFNLKKIVVSCIPKYEMLIKIIGGY